MAAPRPLSAAALPLLWLLLQPLACDNAAAAAVAAGGDGQLLPMGLPGCRTKCGGASVPYPFGIDPGCSLLGFNLTCNDTTPDPELIFLTDVDLVDYYAVTEISLDGATARFTNPSYARNFPLVSWSGSFFLMVAMPPMRWIVVSAGALRGWTENETRAGDETCPEDLGATGCHSSHSTCRSYSPEPRSIYNTTGYVCLCDDGYHGNPYLSNGCKDIDECTLPGKCFGDCKNLPGNYSCQCPKGTIGVPYIENGCVRPETGLIIGLGVGSGAILLFLVLSATYMIHRIMTRKKRMKLRFFKQNHGQLLQQLICQRADISERMILTLDELEKATNNFDKTRELGGGGHGTVYKGILSSLHVVAIKKAKIVVQKEIDDFINEVVILSQINHRNIVKLRGCCLETEVPLLVYEFISNGTLYNHLHVEGLVSLSWKDRVRIAVEIAKALAYLHSLTSVPIIHRDVKSPNILLNDNLTVKLSDFGASRYVPTDQSGLDTTVQGTFGYLDPTYHNTGHLTQKSDVYSFGVILIELLTRKKPISYRSPEGCGLVNHFSTLLTEHNLVPILDPQVVKEGAVEVDDISLLAALCVKFESKDRPTMRHMEMTLESIYAAMEYASSDLTDESEEYYIQVNDMYGGTNEVNKNQDGLLLELGEIISHVSHTT